MKLHIHVLRGTCGTCSTHSGTCSTHTHVAMICTVVHVEYIILVCVNCGCIEIIALAIAMPSTIPVDEREQLQSPAHDNLFTNATGYAPLRFLNSSVRMRTNSKLIHHCWN